MQGNSPPNLPCGAVERPQQPGLKSWQQHAKQNGRALWIKCYVIGLRLPVPLADKLTEDDPNSRTFFKRVRMPSGDLNSPPDGQVANPTILLDLLEVAGLISGGFARR